MSTYFCPMEKYTDADIVIRELRPEDNEAIARVIRSTLKEFGADRPGTVYFDPTTDDLYQLFRQEGSYYQVAVAGDSIVGGAGIFPSAGLPEGTCELVKMYLLPPARGIGLGKKMITSCLEEARKKGYRQVYLETMPELKDALKTYEKFGFSYLNGPLGNTGHFGCALWMLKKL
jgi:putative acetyltransferase